VTLLYRRSQNRELRSRDRERRIASARKFHARNESARLLRAAKQMLPHLMNSFFERRG
jgi:hypothetical protein